MEKPSVTQTAKKERQKITNLDNLHIEVNGFDESGQAKAMPIGKASRQKSERRSRIQRSTAKKAGRIQVAI